jgi:uncharacterized protein YbcV (DUF1398 family)
MAGDQKKSVAAACLHGAESGSMSFPQIVGMLMQAGFESYLIDYRRAVAIYYLPDGDSVELATHKVEQAVAPAFDAPAIRAAIKEAQQLAAGYTYNGFCQKTAAAGCAGYIVSFSGRRVLYFGRSAETHVEHFPD